MQNFEGKNLLRPLFNATAKLHTWIFFVLLLFFCNVKASEQRDHSSDYRSSPTTKLIAAKNFVSGFLERDANPKQVFFIRDATFPAWKDQPMLDCSLDGMVRWIEPQEPYFENAKQEVVVVPIVAELLMVETEGYDAGWGTHPMENGRNTCTWEYEHYNLSNHKFEKLSYFKRLSYNKVFAGWGENMLRRISPKQIEAGTNPPLVVAISRDQRIVRYHIRVSVKRDQPYQLIPQVPRHWFAKDALAKLELSAERTTLKLIAGVSDRDPTASGAELDADLARMLQQREERRWMIKKIQDAIDQPSMRSELITH